MAPSLSTLPPEIFTQIIENIPKNGHLHDLALCCHGFYDLVLPKLYSHLSLKVNLLNDQPSYPKLRSLVSRILFNPTLASHVRSITLDQEWSCQASCSDGEEDSEEVDDDDDDDDEGGEDDNHHIGNAAECLETGNDEKGIYQKAADMPDLFHLLQHMSVFDRSELMEGTENNNEDALMALLFQSVPNLKAMSIEIHPIEAHLFFKVFRRAAAGREHLQVSPPIQSFARLQVVINNCDGSGAETCGMPTNLLYRYIRLPAIREIYMSKVESFHAGEDRLFPLAMLKDGSCPTVEHLELRDRNTETLTNLWLDYWGDDPYLMPSIGDDLTPAPSLGDFRRLKNLKVGMYVLFGHGMNFQDPYKEQEIKDSELPDLGRILPDSLETIYFSHTEGRVGILSEALQRLLRVRQNCLPKLRKITFEAYQAGVKQTPSLNILKDMAVDAEVQLRIITRADEDDLRMDLGRGWDGSVTWAGSMSYGISTGIFVAKADDD
ncbi:MAG: hypothetical protein L6R42_004590 [Xanthoria sp. 1 TBL-2021]|nr:MAG: hypothetical protein L6R42_004590 [Xanthoria sp. 1 TBL-2021]